MLVTESGGAALRLKYSTDMNCNNSKSLGPIPNNISRIRMPVKIQRSMEGTHANIPFTRKSSFKQKFHCDSWIQNNLSLR